MRLGFIGFGEASFEMAKGLKQFTEIEIKAYDTAQNDPLYSALLRERASNSCVSILSTAEQVVEFAQLLIVAVPGSKALEAAQYLLPYLKKDMLYIDVSASAVSVKLKIQETISHVTEFVVDAAMMGALPVYQHKVPILASGLGTDKFVEQMGKFGMNIEKVSVKVGDATAIKLVRSMFIKGLTSLLFEVMYSAQRLNIDDIVLHSIANTINESTFEFTVNRLLTGTAIHADRRSHELQASMEMMEELGVKPMVTMAAKDRLDWLAQKNLKEQLCGRVPANYKSVLELL